MKHHLITDVKKLASELVGDGKSPNLFFVTIGYGWYLPAGKEDGIQVKNAMESVTIGPFDKYDHALSVYKSFPKPDTCPPSHITGRTITQVMIEDRKTGVVKDWEVRESERDNLCRPTEY